MEGLVRRSVPGKGMGIQFRNVPMETRNMLENYLNTLRPTTERQPPPVGVSAPPCLTGFPERQVGDFTALAGSANENQGTAARLKALTGALRELEEQIKEGGVDPRVLSDFRESVDHIRHTARAVQEWLEREAENRDPYWVLSILINDRIRRATQLNQEISLDLDAQEVGHETEGIDPLFEAVTRLQHRLARLCKRQTT